MKRKLILQGKCCEKWLVLLVFFVTMSVSNLFSQIYKNVNSEIGCNAQISSELFSRYVRDKQTNDYGTSSRSDSICFTVPVRFTIVRESDGIFGYNIATDINSLQNSIDELNSNYFGTGVSFEMCGDPIYIDSDYYYENGPALSNQDWLSILYELSYSSSDANVYTYGFGFNGGFAEHPCAQLNTLGGCANDLIDNTITLNFYGQDIPTHEFGHHLGLLHTHGTTQFFHIPVHPDQVDHPYGLNLIKRRELILRVSQDPDTSSLNFPTINCDEAGDLCCDTPVQGLAENLSPGSSLFWPAAGFQFDTTFVCCQMNPLDTCCVVPGGIFQNSASDCTQFGPYKDYNGHSFDDQLGLDVVARNYMGSDNQLCRDNFTEEQRLRMLRFHNIRRSMQYENELCGNYFDEIEYWFGFHPNINEVSIQTKHNGNYKKANTFTAFDGSFNSILYEEVVSAYVRKLGSDGLDNYTHDDWVEGVSILDIVATGRSIIGLSPFQLGYAILAADVDNDNRVTTFDMVEMQKLILLINQNFANHPAPWRFIPEYIPANFGLGFHSNPFDMVIDGQSTNGEASYIENDWEFIITDGTTGQNGFQGYKLGDVDATTGFLVPPPCYEVEYTVVNDQMVQTGTDIAIGFSIQNNKVVSGLQMQLDLASEANFTEASSLFDSFSETDNLNILTDKSIDQVRIVWYNIEGKVTSEDKSQLTIYLDVISPIMLSEIFSSENGTNLLVTDNSDCLTNYSTIEISLLDTNESFTERKMDIATDLLIYPNPTNGFIAVQSNPMMNFSGYSYSILDIFGNKIISGNVAAKQNNVEINFSNVVNGIYLMKIDDGETIYTQKIIKH